MSNESKWRYIFRKDPSLRYNRAKAYWAFGENFYGFAIYATKKQLIDFFTDFAGIERSCRFILKEKEFELPKNQDQKRYSKASEFRLRLSPQNRKDYEKLFGVKDYKQT